MIRRINYKNFLSFLLLSLFVFFAFASEESEESKKEDLRKQQLRSELTQHFHLSSPYVLTYSSGSGLFTDGYIKIKNNSDFEMKNVFIILNPPEQSLKGVFDYFTVGVFRAPANTHKVYFIPAHSYIKINLSDFVQTKTHEIFSLNRYKLNNYLVVCDILYKGELFNFSQKYKFSY